MFRASNNNGFTIVELVVVIIVLGIIAAIAAPKFFDLKGYEELAFKDELVSALRFAQKRAVASGESVGVDITATGFSLLYEDGNPVKDPAGGNFINTETSPFNMTPQIITFDALGRAQSTIAPGSFRDDPIPNVGYSNSGIKIWRETGCVEVN